MQRVKEGIAKDRQMLALQLGRVDRRADIPVII